MLLQETRHRVDERSHVGRAADESRILVTIVRIVEAANSDHSNQFRVLEFQVDKLFVEAIVDVDGFVIRLDRVARAVQFSERVNYVSA